ncbi:hypothetical protein [Paenibacillus sp. y28]|uniref:hypothetical protein n=1 Tax=Paenibacillus sp. y28 TaxID=3129110 RepID=UPI00301A978D
MKVKIVTAAMAHNPGEGYRGSVIFEVEGHKHSYEIMLFSKNGNMWDYTLNFGKDPGIDEEIDVVETALEEDDELFDWLVDTAMESMSS